MRQMTMRGFAANSVFGLNFSVCLFLVVALAIAPVAIDQMHMADTVLLANVGWRGVNGLAAVTDYPHFYGGFAESIVTAAFRAFGVSYKSVDYAFILLFGVAAFLSSALCWKRLRIAEISLLIALAAALILSLDTLEAFQHFTPTHAFVYNHVGIVLMLALTVFACRPLADRRAETISALAAGGVFYMLVLLKTTFGLFGLSLLLACMVQKRWVSAGLVLVGATVVMLLMDPGMARAIGSLHLLVTSSAAADAGGLDGRLLMASLMLETQALPIAIVLLLAFALWQRSRPVSVRLIASLLICGAGYSAAMLTTGGTPQHKLLPFLIVTALLFSRALAENPPTDGSPQQGTLFTAVPIVLAYLIILPALATSAHALSQSFHEARSPLVAQGPLSSYVLFDRDVPEATGSASERLAAATANTLKRARKGKATYRDQYVLLADGVALLLKVDHVRAFGIIPNGRFFDFTAPLQSKVVKSFPVWPTLDSPELMTAAPLERDVDMVMMLDEIPALKLVSSALRVRMGQEFRPCRRSAFWTLYVRRSLTSVSCATQAAQPEARNLLTVAVSR